MTVDKPDIPGPEMLRAKADIMSRVVGVGEPGATPGDLGVWRLTLLLCAEFWEKERAEAAASKERNSQAAMIAVQANMSAAAVENQPEANEISASWVIAVTRRILRALCAPTQEQLWRRLSLSVEFKVGEQPGDVVRRALVGLLHHIADQMERGSLEPFTSLVISGQTQKWDCQLLATAYGPGVGEREFTEA